MNISNIQEPRTLAIALGANLPSKAGGPLNTLIAARPKIEQTICEWLKVLLAEQNQTKQGSEDLRWRWSSLFETKAFGGPTEQPNYVNAVLVLDGPRLKAIRPTERAAKKLLERFLIIENKFGRSRTNSKDRWGPRTLDIDLLAWGDLHVKTKPLQLPHPRLIERSFVVVPLGCALCKGDEAPIRLAGNSKWEE